MVRVPVGAMATRSDGVYLVHRGERAARRWRGSLVDIADLALLMRHEVAKLDLPLEEWATVGLSDCRQEFPSIKAFALAARTRLDRDAVEYIDVGCGTGRHRTKAEIRANPMTGLEIVTESQDRLWARGAAEILGEELGPHEMPQFRRERRPLKALELAGIAFVSCWIAGVVAAGILLHILMAVSGLACVMILSLAYLPLGDALDRRVAYPPFELTDPGEDRGEMTSDSPGWAVRMEGALRRRPALNILVAFAFGILINKTSDWI